MQKRMWVALIVATSLAGTASDADAVVFKSFGHGGKRPRFMALSGDGTLDAGRLRWLRWGGPVAVGTGVIYWHGCNPYCAAGKRHSATGSVHLSHIVYCEETPYAPEGDYYSLASVYVRSHGRDVLLSASNWSPCPPE